MNTAQSDSELFPCPCCGSKTVDTPGTFEICDVCEWEDDPSQSADPDYAGGANRLSLSEAQKQWAQKQSG